MRSGAPFMSVMCSEPLAGFCTTAHDHLAVELKGISYIGGKMLRTSSESMTLSQCLSKPVSEASPRMSFSFCLNSFPSAASSSASAAKRALFATVAHTMSLVKVEADSQENSAISAGWARGTIAEIVPPSEGGAGALRLARRDPAEGVLTRRSSAALSFVVDVPANVAFAPVVGRLRDTMRGSSSDAPRCFFLASSTEAPRCFLANSTEAPRLSALLTVMFESTLSRDFMSLLVEGRADKERRS
mmetsp:Transcript_32062/g.78678  ORF Transcript_32062/g.78678 Transcript_32062/m.78678 type:complete len:244 (-) Transcript_32062:1292-2023(-)